MQRSTLITLLLMVAILALVAYFAWKALSKNDSGVSDSSAVATTLKTDSANTFTDFEGNKTDLNQYFGSVIVAHAWASWVPSSPQSLQELSSIQKDFLNKNVVVLAINRGETIETAKAFLDAINVNDLTLVADQNDVYFKNSGGRTMPETIIYDTEGNVLLHKRGVLKESELRNFLTNVTEE